MTMKIPNELFFEHLEAVLAQGHTVELRVRGHSMRPLLRDGRSVVLLAPYPGSFRPNSCPANEVPSRFCSDTLPGSAQDGSRPFPFPDSLRHRELRPGDVVLFRSGRQRILHRIVRIDGDRLTLAGDGNCGISEHCTKHEVTAVMVGELRPDGTLLRCTSLRWRLPSRLWLTLPVWFRRQLLRVMWHLGIR